MTFSSSRLKLPFNCFSAAGTSPLAIGFYRAIEEISENLPVR